MLTEINSTQWVIYLKGTQQSNFFSTAEIHNTTEEEEFFTDSCCEEQSLYIKVHESAVICCQYGQMAKRID